MNTLLEPRCNGCHKRPGDIGEYKVAAREAGMTPDEFVLHEEGTLNTRNGHFLCTECYVKAGMPTAPGGGWKAP